MSDAGTAVEGTAEKAEQAFTRKLGPLPVWGWALILGVAAFVFVKWRQRSGSQSSATDGSGDDAYASASDLDTSGSSNNSASSTSPVTNDGGASASTVPAATDDSWLLSASNGLTASGSNRIATDNALTNYLSGAALSPDQAQLVTTALNTYGEPPSGVQSINVATPPQSNNGQANTVTTPTPVQATPAPATTSKAAPKAAAPKPKATPPKANPTEYTSYRVKRGDTLTSIARHYYGSSASEYITDIARASGISDVNKIYAGQDIRIPHTSGSVGSYRD